MLNVTQKYLEDMKHEENNRKHKYTVKNVTRNLDLTELLNNETLTISRFLRTAQGNISPSNIRLSLEARAEIPAEFLVRNFHRQYQEFKNKKWSELIYEEVLEEYLVKIGDLIVVKDIYNDEELTIFTGNVTELQKTDTQTKRTINITVDDNTIKGYEYFFSEDLVFENYYINNNKEKNKSLLYILCKDYLEIPAKKINIQDIKNSNGQHIRIPIATFKKNTKIMKEIGEIVRSFYGNIYTMPDGTLKINSIFDKSYLQKLDITLGNKKANYPILEFIETTEKEPKENKVEIKYEQLQIGDPQEVFLLTGHNGTNEDAKILVKKKSKGEDYWRIDFNDVIELNKTPTVEAYFLTDDVRQQETPYTDFILEWINDRTAKLKFNNRTDKDIFIKKFSFTGRPVTKFNDNSIFYTENKKLTEKNTNIKTVNYNYIVDKTQAIELSKHTFYNECRPYRTIKLRTNNMPFLELEDIIKVDFKKYNGDFQIIAINQTNLYTELVLKEYREYQGNSEFIISEKSTYTGGIKSFGQIKREEKQLSDRLNEIERRLQRLEQLRS